MPIQRTIKDCIKWCVVPALSHIPIKRPLLVCTVLLVMVLAACVPQPSPTAAMVGASAPDFTLANALGGQTSLSDFEGEPVLLFFHMAVD